MTATVANYCKGRTIGKTAYEDLEGNRFVSLTRESYQNEYHSHVKYPSNSNLKLHVLGVTMRKVRKDQAVGIVNLPGSRVVVETGGSTTIEAGDPVKVRNDGTIEKADATDGQEIVVGVALGPEKTDANGSQIYTSIILR